MTPPSRSISNRPARSRWSRAIARWTVFGLAVWAQACTSPPPAPSSLPLPSPRPTVSSTAPIDQALPSLDPCLDPMAWICSLPPQTSDFTGIVESDTITERRTAALFSEVINRAATETESQEKKAVFPATLEEQGLLEERFSQLVYTEARVARLVAAFSWTQREIIHWIAEQPERILSPFEKDLMTKHVRRVRLDLPPVRLYDPDHPDILLRSDILFEPLADDIGRLILGGAFVLGADSWFALVFAFAHELGHALDPCHFESNQTRILAQDRLAACFVQKHWVSQRRTRVKCGANDQLSEVFSDWIATEMVSRALLRFSARLTRNEVRAALINSVRDLCSYSSTNPQEANLYASDSVRIHEIFFGHPLLRKVLRCRNRHPVHRNRCELGVGSFDPILAPATFPIPSPSPTPTKPGKARPKPP